MVTKQFNSGIDVIAAAKSHVNTLPNLLSPDLKARIPSFGAIGVHTTMSLSGLCMFAHRIRSVRSKVRRCRVTGGSRKARSMCGHFRLERQAISVCHTGRPPGPLPPHECPCDQTGVTSVRVTYSRALSEAAGLGDEPCKGTVVIALHMPAHWSESTHPLAHDHTHILYTGEDRKSVV